MMRLCGFSELLLVFREGLIYFLVENWDLWMVLGCITELISLCDFGQYVLVDEFSLFIYVALLV